MSRWTCLTEHRVDLSRSEVRAYVRAQCGLALRRAGLSAEFTVATALACWRQIPEPESPAIALLWTSLALAGTENTDCLTEILQTRELPMPFQFIASQPHMAALHASPLLPGLVHATTLTHSATEVERVLLPALAHGRPWTHVLLGEVRTPHPWAKEADRFRADWKVLVREIQPR